MAQFSKSVSAITLFVDDLPRSKEFYERVFEVAPADEEEGTVIFEFGNLSLRLLSRAEAEKEMLGEVPLADPGSGVGVELAMRVARFVGQRKLSLTADTYTHVLSGGQELDYSALLDDPSA
jgi:catechol 2,3-dioxygenase-like lactoylglutathione lyase family enzyme